MRWIGFLLLLPLSAWGYGTCDDLDILSGDSVLGVYNVPADLDLNAFRRQKVVWTKNAIQAVAARNDLSPEGKADAFESLGKEIQRRAESFVEQFKAKNPTETPPLSWGFQRKTTPFGIAFEGNGEHVLLFGNDGRMWEIKRFTSERIGPGWDPGWDPAKRPEFQQAPRLVVPQEK